MGFVFHESTRSTSDDDEEDDDEDEDEDEDVGGGMRRMGSNVTNVRDGIIQ